MKDLVMIVLLSVIMTLNLLDVLSDMQLGVPVYHLVVEGILVALSACGALYISFDLLRRSREMQLLKSKLANADARICNISSRMQAARQEYTKEIASVRSTKEKTVRQQASAIYAKADVDGRHTFCAWFMEDFIQPVASADTSQAA